MRRTWNDKEIELLKKYAKNGDSTEQIAIKMERSELLGN